MSYRLIVKRGTDVYEHIPLPEIVISHAFRYKENSADLVEDTERWTITGYLIAPEGSIKLQTTEFSTFYEGGELEYVRFQDDDDIVDELADENGIRIVSLNFPEGSGPEWATKRKYVIELEGLNYASSTTSAGEYNYTIKYSTDQSGTMTRTISGTVFDRDGEAAYSIFTTLKSDNGWATWTAANLITDEFTQNDTDTECRFTIVHKKYWIAFPTGVTNASVDYDVRTDDQNVTRGRISGWFEGSTSNCADAIANVYPLNSVVLDYRTTRNYNTNRTSFSISYIEVYRNDVLEYKETLSIDAQVYDFVYHRVLGGAPPVRQVTSRGTAKAVQAGTVTRLGVMPTPPPPRWNTMYVKSSRVTQATAQYRTALGQFAYTINWVYSYEFPTTPSF